MNNKDYIIRETEYLFDCDFFSDDFDPEDECVHAEHADKLMDRYDWKDIFDVWNNYLHTRCISAEQVINFCNLFVYYGGHDNYIPCPYEFIGYLFYRVDIEKYWERVGSVLDSISIGILEKIGEISLIKDPNYRPEKDPRIIAEVEKYKAMEGGSK